MALADVRDIEYNPPMTDSTPRDYHAEHEARMAWLKKHLVKADRGMDSEYRVDLLDIVRLRMFRTPRNSRRWGLVAHGPIENPVLRNMGWLFEVEGERDRETFETRERVLSWIAIRWDYAVDKAMKAA